MRERSLYNLRGGAWLLSVVFVLMATVSGASWQCLDGHPCPPGCTMQHRGDPVTTNGSASGHACCAPHSSPNTGKAHCVLCSAARPNSSQVKARCTSPVCVLRTQMKPDVSVQAHAFVVFDITAVLPAVPVYVLVPEVTGSISFGSSRAPPDRLIVRFSSPRAPPVSLI